MSEKDKANYIFNYDDAPVGEHRLVEDDGRVSLRVLKNVKKILELSKSIAPIRLDEEVENYESEVQCLCGGYAQRVDCTQEEIADHSLNCGRDYAHCCRAFACCVCGSRIQGRAKAPDMMTE